MKTIIFTLLVISLFALTTFAGNRDRSKVNRSTYGLPNETNNNVSFSSNNSINIKNPNIILGGSFFVNGIEVGPEILTGNNGFYDYMTNGDCRHYLQVDESAPGLLHAIYTVTDTNDVYPAANTRKTVYAYSADGGLTWTVGGPVPTSARTGFGNLILKPTGEAIIGMHAGTVVNAQLHIDVAPQAATWSSYNAQLPARLWPIQSIMTNGNILLACNQNTTVAPDSLVWGVFNGTTISQWNHLYAYNSSAVSNQRWASSSGANGNSIIISNPISVVDSLNGNFVRLFTSSNNANTFSGPTNIFRPFVDGADTIVPFFGQDAIYKPGTNNWYFVMNAIGSRYRTARLYLIRSSDLTPVKIADSSNVPVMVGLYKTFAGITGIDHPSLGWSDDGNVLYCAYSVAVDDTGSRGWNTRDIFYQYSTNDGSTWSTPTRITNTPTIDEGYPSLSFWNKGSTGNTYELNISYMKDPGDGPSCFNAGQTLAEPPSRNVQIYRKITDAAGPIGINNISNEVPGSYSLNQNFPNPFNPVTKIRFAIPKQSNITLEVYDVTGKLVSIIAKNVTVTAGIKEVEFNASNLPSGVYFYSLKSENFSETKKMILVK
ncbi:MAG: T9SS type A sorting domain-containing protein [Ignavibacteria bacterium]|nr:T9SS type A sorting domain-containing protein [Ignavibacteria bacterium]